MQLTHRISGTVRDAEGETVHCSELTDLVVRVSEGSVLTALSQALSRSLSALRCAVCCPLSCVRLCRPCGLLPTRQEHWSGLPCPPPGDLPSPGMEPKSLSPALAGRFFSISAAWAASPTLFDAFTSLKFTWRPAGSLLDAFPVSLPCCVMTANPASIPGARKPGPGDTCSNAFSFFSVVILCYSPLLFSCLFCCCLLFLVRIDLQYCVSFSYTHIYIQILFHYRLLQILYEFPALFSESFLFTCFIHSGINLLIQYCYFGPSSPFPLW